MRQNIAQLPRRFEVGVNFSYSSTPPFGAYIGQIDFYNDATNSDLLLGTTANAFYRGMGRADLEQLVTLNAKHALTRGDFVCSRKVREFPRVLRNN
jgi:hypothetical protein